MQKLIYKNLFEIEIYTDGAALGNPGPGGYGTILLCNGKRKELSQGYKYTTNNRMELLAVIEGLKALKNENCKVTVYSDSQYVVNAIEKKWVFGWVKKRFIGKKNPDLWLEFLEYYRKHDVKLVWVKGHAGIKENERADFLSVQAANSKNLLTDKGYIESL